MKFFKILLRNYNNSYAGIFINYISFLITAVWLFFAINNIIGCGVQKYINPILINHGWISPNVQAVVSHDYLLQSIIGAGVLILLGLIAISIYLIYYISLNIFKFFQMSYNEYKCTKCTK